jgi:predicted transcriptional regulator
LALTLWEYAGHPEARRTKGLLPSTLTHAQLAALVGASRPRVSQALTHLERKGIFIRQNKQILVQKRVLRRYLEREHESLL